MYLRNLARGRETSCMTGRSTFMVDTNVLVYSVDPTDRTKQVRANQVLAALALSGRGSLTVQVLGEFFNTSTRRLRPLIPADSAEELTRNFARNFRVLGLDAALVFSAIQMVRETSVSYWDALILAAANA